MCTFDLPWSRGLTGKAAMDHATRPPTDIRELCPDIHPVLAEAVHFCLQQDLSKRCPTIDEFLKRIKDVNTEYQS